MRRFGGELGFIWVLIGRDVREEFEDLGVLLRIEFYKVK